MELSPEKKLSVTDINTLIKESGVETGLLSDTYHTFDELYEHRIALYIKLCEFIDLYNYSDKCDKVIDIWRTTAHSDGSVWDDWFILGINTEPGQQISYHLPLEKWDSCSSFARTLERAPEYDSHTSADVLNRLKAL